MNRRIVSVVMLSCVISSGLWAFEGIEVLRCPMPLADQQFGRSISLQGDRLLVGNRDLDPSRTGEAHVFQWNAGGDTWDCVVELGSLVPGLSGGDVFGIEVVLANDWAFVTAQKEQGVGNNNGVIYVFEYKESTWSYVQKIESSNHSTREFGHALDSDESYLVVGDPIDVSAGSRAGAVWVYENVSGTWTLSTDSPLVPVPHNTGDEFGKDVAISQGRIVVGAPKFDGTNPSDPNCDSGCAFVFELSSGSWTQTQQLIGSSVSCGIDVGWDCGAGSDINIGDHQGTGVDIDGDVIAFTAPGFDGAGGLDQGSTYVFTYAGSWSENAMLVGLNASAHEYMESVALDGDLLAVGARSASHPGFAHAGRAYMFRFIGSSWVQRLERVAGDPGDCDWFGVSIAVDARRVAVGAHLHDHGGNAESGAAYTFRVDGNLATRFNYGTGCSGSLGIPTLASSADPVIGTSINLSFGNSLGSPTQGFVFRGFAEAFLPFLGCTLLVQPIGVIPIGLPGAGLCVPFSIPCEELLDGWVVYLQSLQLDPAAPQGVSFSPGLCLQFGY